MKIVIAGSSGFLGTALRHSLAADGHDIVRLVRRKPDPGDSRWDPYTGTLDQAVIGSADVVVNLAGAPLVGNPHSKKWAHRVHNSRVTTTRVLAEAIARTHPSGSGRPAYLAGAGVSIYGDHGDEVLDESTESRGDSFLTGVSRDWEEATEPARAAGARVCIIRTSPVIDRANPPLKQMLPLTKLGLGTRMGPGRQYFPIISLRDWVGAASFLAHSDSSSGAFNFCCPETPTNREFTEALADAVGRRARLAAPGRLLQLAAGRMAPEVLSSVRAVPAALLDDGYTFRDYDVRDVIAAALNG